MSKIHPTSVYQMTRPGRFEPKFIGIADICVDHKRKRKELQKIYKDTHNNLLYVEKRNLDLQKSLDQKQTELQRLSKMKQRHNGDMIKKMKMDEDNKMKMDQLRRITTFQRNKLKSSIQQRVSEMKHERRRSKNQAKRKSQQLKDQLVESNDFQFKQRRSMYQTIQTNKQIGNKKIDAYYRKKNLQSLNNYNKIIKMEDDKAVFYQVSVQKMNKTISVITKDNQKKEKKISTIDENIQQLNPLKSFFSSRLNRTNIIDFSRKSSQKSISSKRPSEILLDDFLTSANQIIGSKVSIRKKETYVKQQNPEQEVIEI